MARRKKSDTQWEQPSVPPPPLFTGQKEKDFVKQVNDELIERVIGQQVAYFSIDVDRSDFHPIYGEAIDKTFLPPIRVYALVKWEGQTNLFSEGIGIDKATSIEIHFHKRRLTEDQDLYVREGDFVLYGDRYYEIVSTSEPDLNCSEPVGPCPVAKPVPIFVNSEPSPTKNDADTIEPDNVSSNVILPLILFLPLLYL